MSSTVESKLDQILQDLDLIKRHLKIVPNKEAKIDDGKSSIESYEIFAKEELHLNEKTITNQLSTIARFLSHSKGIITNESVKSFLNSNESPSWKANQLKALRRYIRDFLKLGNWIAEFDIPKTKAKIKHLPTDQELLAFAKSLDDTTMFAFFLMYTSGLRINEVLNLRVENLDFSLNSIDASNIHEGSTKHSWVSFFTGQVADPLQKYIASYNLQPADYLFSVESRTIQNRFKSTSTLLGIEITPHLLRSAFTEKCTIAKIPDKYIDAFCGRVSSSVIAKHYTDYSPKNLRKYYDMVEPLLILHESS